VTPYYQDEYVTMYHGDCREIVPTLGQFDLLLTDPPYGINGGRGGTSKERNKGAYTDYFEDTPENIRDCVVPVINKCLFICKRGILTPGNRCFSLYPQPDSFGCFYQPAAVGMQSWGNCDAQPIFYYGKSVMAGKNMGRPCSFTLTERPSCKSHPCSKPIKAWSKLVELHTESDHIILDPFAGSGTTGVAAKLLNRKCTLIEKEEKYCEIAARRLSQGVLPLYETPGKESE
jgi:site-specific DNA-methyltransferase (adenine-specific)